jgi:hypothetical protein
MDCKLSLEHVFRIYHRLNLTEWRRRKQNFDLNALCCKSEIATLHTWAVTHPNGCPIIHYLLGCNQARSHGGAMHPLQIWVHLLGVFEKCQGLTRWSARCKTYGTPPSRRIASFEPSWLETTVLQKCMHVQNARIVIGSIILLNWFFFVLTNALFTFMHTYILSTYTTASYMYINECTYMHPYWKPLHPLCSWSGYWPGCNTM